VIQRSERRHLSVQHLDLGLHALDIRLELLDLGSHGLIPTFFHTPGDG